MAKRFTCTEKWNKKFLRGLQAPYKLLWFYILDECSVAGIWEVDFEVAQIKIGEKLNEQKAIEAFSERIVLISNGDKWFIPPFIEFQYGKLQDTNRAHTKAIETLKKFCLLNDRLEIIKPLTSPLQGAMVEVEVKEQVMVKEKEQVIAVEIEKIVMPFESEKFKKFWDNWREYKSREFKFKFKSLQSEQAAINKLVELADGKEEYCYEIIIQSMANGWKGFFELNKKTNTNGKQDGHYADIKQEIFNKIGGIANSF
jgi:hypothetical protein